MRAITVCVGYEDIAAITLPYNRHHFSEMMMVTDMASFERVEKIVASLDVHLHVTNVFTRNGASFNKWAALEEGLDIFGRHGWLCIMDADILWPKKMEGTWSKKPCREHVGKFQLECPACNAKNADFLPAGCVIGNLYTPMRRMWSEWPNYPNWYCKMPPYEVGSPPEERHWGKFPLHPNQTEWAGWTQIFHADDPHLPKPPWHDVGYGHAGTADSWFQQLWPNECKLRPPFTCLHLGQAGRNWMGRVTPLVDGSIPKEATEREVKMREMRLGRLGKTGMDKFKHERIDGK